MPTQRSLYVIDWYDLAANAIWITGCALALAAVSYAHWEASMRGERLRVSLRRPWMQIATHLAGALFCLGLAVTSRSVIELIIWLILVVLFCIRLVGHFILC